MIRAHKIRLYPNKKQETYFTKACGVARFAYNWALGEWKRLYEAGEKVNESKLRKQLNAIKREQFPWMLEVTKCAPQLAIKNDLNRAFKNFFAGRADFPKFHKKGMQDSFHISNDQFQIEGRRIRVPNLGWVRMAENLRYEGKIQNAVISRRADRWYLSMPVERVEEQAYAPKSENQAIGVDLGVKAFATLSDGTVIIGPKASRKYGKKLRRLNQKLSRRQGAKKGERPSKNFQKARKQLARLYARIADLRADETHKLTTKLVKSYALIGIEDLNIKGMLSNHRLAHAISDMSFYEFRRQLEYKGETYGSRIIVADRWFASSKICSVCGNKRAELPLHIREWECEACHTLHDRDVNAAINLQQYAVKNA